MICTTKTRLEQDHLGQIELPADALYGVATARAQQNFAVSGYLPHPRFIWALAQVKLACCRVNARFGWLGADIAPALEQALTEIADGKLNHEFVVDALQGGAGTSTNMNINEVAAARANQILGHDAHKGPVQPLAHVNLHQSTNDVYPTALKVATLAMLKTLETKVTFLQEALQAKEKEFADVLKLGRTQLQDAVPLTLGMEFSAYSDAIARDRWRIFKSRERIKVVNLGGTAIGTGLNAPRKFIFEAATELRRLTGLNLARGENLVDATANADPFVEVGGMLKAFAVNLFKIAGDLRLLASGPHGGLAEITLPAQQSGSTIMPGKVNPVIPEMVQQVALKVMTNDDLIARCASLGALQLNQFMPLINQALLESLHLLINASDIFANKCVSGIAAQRKNCRKHVTDSNSVATILVPYLGYHVVEQLVDQAEQQGLSVYQVIINRGLYTAQQLDELLAPEKMYKLGFDHEQLAKLK